MIPFYKSPLAYVVIGFFLSVALVAQAQFWTPPPADFPFGNVYVPVTTGSSTQYKQGTLRLDYLQFSTSTGVGQNALTIPYNRGIVGLDISNRAQSIIYPYAGAPWGLFLSNRNVGGSGGVITLLSTQTGSQSRLQLYPDGRITTMGAFVLPNSATTSLPATARVPGALVYWNGAAYMYNGTVWNPVGSGAGGGAGWTLAGPASNPLLYTTATTTNVGIGTVNPTEALEVRGNLLIDKALISQTYPTGWYYKPISSVYGSGNVIYSGASNYQWWLDAGLVPAGSTWDSVKITNVNTGSGVGGVKLCEDSTMDNAQCGLPADGFWDASASGPDTVYDLYKFVDPEDTSGTAYVIAAKRFQKTRSTIMPGGNLRVTGWIGADGGIDNPATLVLTAGWHALRWRGPSKSIGDIKLTINSAQGSASNNVVGQVYFITNSGTYTAALPDSQIVQPGTIFALRLTARKLPRLPAEIAPEWTLNTGSLTIGNVTADGNTISAPMVKGTTGICIGADCRNAWPAGGSGGSITYPLFLPSAGNFDLQSVANNWTGFNLSSGDKKRIIVGVDTTRKDNVFDIEDITNWEHRLELRADGSAYFGAPVAVKADPTNDQAFQIDHVGAANPAKFRVGTDGGLVVNTNAIDTLFMKDGKAAIGDGVGSQRFEVQKGNLSVNSDPNGQFGYLYEPSTAPGTWDPGHTLTPACGCESDPNTADCPATYYSPTNVGAYCYDYSQASDPSRGGQLFDISYNYDRKSNTVQLSGGIGYFQNKIVIGHPSLSGIAPAVSLAPAGVAKYDIQNNGGVLGFVNGAGDTKFSIDQDGNVTFKAVHGVQSFDVPGVTSFTVPPGVNSLKVELWGGSGGGGGGGCVGWSGQIGGGGGGGGAGGYGIGFLQVQPGQTFRVVVGGGGGHSSNSSCPSQDIRYGTPGVPSSFGTLLAEGGEPGNTAVGTIGGVGGMGGGTNSLLSLSYPGGVGFPGKDNSRVAAQGGMSSVVGIFFQPPPKGGEGGIGHIFDGPWATSGGVGSPGKVLVWW